MDIDVLFSRSPLLLITKELSKALRGGKNSQREVKSMNRTPLVTAKSSAVEDDGVEEDGKKMKNKIRQIRRRLTSSRGGKRAGSGEVGRRWRQ